MSYPLHTKCVLTMRQGHSEPWCGAKRLCSQTLLGWNDARDLVKEKGPVICPACVAAKAAALRAEADSILTLAPKDGPPGPV